MMPHSTRFGLIAAIFMLAAAAMAQAPGAPPLAPTLPPIPRTIAPAYAISGQVADLSQAILAEVPGLGQISSLDLLMFAGVEPTLVGVPLEIWVTPDSIAAEPFQQAIRHEIDRLAALASLASKSAGWNPPADLNRRLGFDGAMAGYAENVIANQVKVEDVDVHAYYIAHPEKYLQRRRINARYIFIRVPMAADAMTRSQIQQQLEAIARDIRDGKTTFEEAAAQNSMAPSAAEGGRIPEFVDGTYFREFERQLLDVKPGETTQVFDGPGGYYLAQLISATPAMNIPLSEVTPDIRRILAQEHVKHYYRSALGKLQARYRIQNYAAGVNYEYMNLYAPLAHVGMATLTRPQFLLCYENPVQPDYTVNRALVQQNVLHWIEGEMVLQEMESLGRGNDRYIARSRELATIALRADETLKRQIDPNRYTGADASTHTLQAGASGGIRSVMVAQIQMTPTFEKDTPQAAILATDRQLNTLNTTLDRGVLELSEPVVLSEWVGQIDLGTSETAAAAIAELQERIDAAPRPTIKMTVTQLGWVDAVPDTQWYRLLHGLAPGQISPTVKFAATITRYVVLDERPLNIAKWKGRTSTLEQMAWRALTDRAIQAEIERLHEEKAIKYRL